MSALRNATKILTPGLMGLGFEKDRIQSDARNGVFARFRASDSTFCEVWIVDSYERNGFYVSIRFGVVAPTFMENFSGMGPDELRICEVMSVVLDKKGCHQWRPSAPEMFSYELNSQGDPDPKSLVGKIGSVGELCEVERILRSRVADTDNSAAHAKSWMQKIGLVRNRKSDEVEKEARIRQSGAIYALSVFLLASKRVEEGSALMREYIARNPGWRQRDKVESSLGKLLL